MIHYSPLRYPGGKNCIFPFVSKFFYENGLKSTSEIIDQYFEADVSLLQGAGGFVAGLLEFILHDRDFGRLLMIK